MLTTVQAAAHRGIALRLQAAEFMGCRDLRAPIIEWHQQALLHVIRHYRAVEPATVSAAEQQLESLSIPRFASLTAFEVLFDIIQDCISHEVQVLSKSSLCAVLAREMVATTV